MKLEARQLEAEMLQRTYDKEILLRLGGVQIKQHYNEKEIFMVNTSMLSGRDEYLITVQYINVSTIFNIIMIVLSKDKINYTFVYSRR